MTEDDFTSLKRGLAQAKAWQAGARDGYVEHTPEDMAAYLEYQKRKIEADYPGVKNLTPVGALG